MLPADTANVALVSTGAMGSFADPNVGTAKPVTISGLTLSGSAAGNYTLTQPTASANIAALGLSVSGITAANKVYDGTTTAALDTSSAALVGVLPGDTAKVTLVTSAATGAFADSNVGTNKPVSISGLTLSGPAAENYTVIQPTTTADILVNPMITVTSPRLVDHEFTVSVSTVPGANYIFEYKNSLSDPAWQAAQTQPGNGSRIVLTDSTATNSARFYRVRVE